MIDKNEELIGCIQTLGDRIPAQVGFTEECAIAWATDLYFSAIPNDTFPLDQFCRTICEELIQAPPNDPITCELNDCLQCNEDIGVFEQLSGRTRRNSGILSNIVRGCDEIAEIRHDHLCNF